MPVAICEMQWSTRLNTVRTGGSTSRYLKLNAMAYSQSHIWHCLSGFLPVSKTLFLAFTGRINGDSRAGAPDRSLIEVPNHFEAFWLMGPRPADSSAVGRSEERRVGKEWRAGSWQERLNERVKS